MADNTPWLDPFYNPKSSKSFSDKKESKQWETQGAVSTQTQDSPGGGWQLNIDNLSTEEKNSAAVALTSENQNSHTAQTKSDTKPHTSSVISSVQTTKPNSPQILAKQGTKISFKTFAIWCGIFFWLFLILVSIGLYIAISDPTSLANLGLDIGTVKSILLIFTVLFFGLLFFVWFGFAALNGYRFFTTKEWSKVKYGIWFIVWLILLFGSIGLGLLSYTRINALSEERTYNTNDMIIPHLQVKKFDDGDPTIWYSRVYAGTPWLPLIAPSYFDMQMNEPILNSLVGDVRSIGFTKFTLECGNGQIITNSATEISAQLFFNGSCLYLKKWQYKVKMSFSYFDSQQGIEVTRTIDNAATLDIATDFAFNVDGGERKLNDNKNEVILGTAPSKILVDAQKIFTDLGIPTIQINWDLDGNGSIDKQNRVSFTYYFDEPKLYNSYFTIPLNIPSIPFQLRYMTRFRVNAGDVPLCDLVTSKVGESKYELAVLVDDEWTDISDYSIDIIDNQTDEIVSTLQWTNAKFEYTFPNGKSYRVRGYFTTTEGKRWSCEANTLLDIGFNSYSFVNTLSIIWPNDSSYRVLTETWDDRVEGDSITLSDIPTTLKLSIDKIVPEIVNPQISVFENGTLKNPTKAREYVFKMDSESSKEIRLLVSDNKWKSATRTYVIGIERKNLIGILKASKTVGFDPMIVEFDASITKLNDPTDEVVYFSWDFGDGEIRNNTSVGKITHTYKFDTVKENGEYQPKVTVKTKKGLTQTIPLSEKIIIKRQIKTFDILIPSHPAQLAKVGDIVDFAIQADGKITGVTRDFGNGKRLNGQSREFMETTMRYDESGLYEIFATVEFSDSPPISQSIKLKVE